MPTPFPGVDPYLERHGLWPDVHNRLIVSVADVLAPQLRPRYFVSIEERTYMVVPDDLLFTGRADVTVVQPFGGDPLAGGAYSAHDVGFVTVELPVPDELRETYLEIRSTADNRVVTMLEVLSPSNKRPGDGREQYVRKRLQVLGTLSHLVEVDLLRGGPPMTMYGSLPTSDYRILVSRAERRPRADLLAWSIRQPIPIFHLPLLPDDTEPILDLNHLLHELYDRAGYDLRIDYAEAADLPLIDDDDIWADTLLRASGLR